MKTLNELTLLDKSSALPESISNQKGESLAYHMFYRRHCLRPVFYYFTDIQRIYLRFLSGMACHGSLFSATWLVIPYSLFCTASAKHPGNSACFCRNRHFGLCRRGRPLWILLLVLIMSSSLAPTCVPPVQAGLWLSGWMQPLIMLLITQIPSSSFPADKALMNLAPKQMP